MSDETQEEWRARIGIGQTLVGVGMRHVGSERKRIVPREDNGKPAGHYVDHWDGRVDATAYAPIVNRVGNTGGAQPV